MAADGKTARRVDEIVVARLTRYLGPNTARVALKTFSQRLGGRPPEALAVADAPQLLEALRPMLRTLLGRERAEEVLQHLERDLR